MRRVPLVIAAFVLLAVTAHLTAEAAPPWGDLNDWVGKYPTDRQTNPTRHLLDLAPIRDGVRQLLNSSDLKRLTSLYTVEKPIVKIDHFVVVEKCMPHNCPSAHAIVVLDTEDRRLWAGFFDRTDKAVSTRWYGTDDHLVLPQPILDEFHLSGN
jgi:hypothetical protein